MMAYFRVFLCVCILVIMKNVKYLQSKGAGNLDRITKKFLGYYADLRNFYVYPYSIELSLCKYFKMHLILEIKDVCASTWGCEQSDCTLQVQE